jgi:hypothetical protein
MYSPTRNASSVMKKIPETMSRTSACEPKLIASPMTPAPASSGAMFTPSCDSATSTAITMIVMPSRMRSTGSTVVRREAGRASPSSSSPILFTAARSRASVQSCR